MQINYNKYIAKIICFFGPLVFGIYLIHFNNFVDKEYVRNFFHNQPKDLSLNSVLWLILGKTFKLCIVCLIIDFFRHLLFTILRLRKIFFFIENKLKEILNKF